MPQQIQSQALPEAGQRGRAHSPRSLRDRLRRRIHNNLDQITTASAQIGARSMATRFQDIIHLDRRYRSLGGRYKTDAVGIRLNLERHIAQAIIKSHSHARLLLEYVQVRHFHSP